MTRLLKSVTFEHDLSTPSEKWFLGPKNVKKGSKKSHFLRPPKITFRSKMGHLWTGLLGSTYGHMSKKGVKKVTKKVAFWGFQNRSEA